MERLPDGFSTLTFIDYKNIKDENTVVQKLDESNDLFEFVKCAFSDVNWRNSNSQLLKKVVLRLENSISNGKLSSDKIDEIKKLSERILHSQSVVIKFSSGHKYLVIKTLEIDKFLFEKLKRTTNYTVNNDGITVLYFNDRNINKLSQHLRIELANETVRQSTKEKGISKYIQKYGINPETEEGQNALIEIAKQAVQKNGTDVLLNICHYRIDTQTEKGQKALIEIVKLAAQQKESAQAISQNVHKLGINSETEEGQQGLIEIAKLVAQQNGSVISRDIRNFKIDDEEALAEIAKLAAQNNAEGVFIYLSNYNIQHWTKEGQKALTEMAKLGAQKDGLAISRHIQDYKIKDRSELIEIAKHAAQQSGWGVSKYIKNYGINADTDEGQATLIEIAKIAAQQDGWRVSEFIEEYEIDGKTKQGQQGLREIAIIAAQQNGEGVSKYIKNYGIKAKTEEGRKAITEIANLTVQQIDGKIVQYIREYKIPTAERLKILMMGYQKTIEANGDLTALTAEILYELKRSEVREPNSQLMALTKICQQKWPGISLNTEISIINNIKNPHRKQLALNWFTELMIGFHNINEQTICKLQKQNFFKYVLSFRASLMRYTMTNILSDHILNSDESMDLFIGLTSNRQDKKYNVLASVFLMKLGLNPRDLDKIVEEIDSKTINSGKHKYALFDHYPNLYALLEVLECIGNESSLSSEMKCKVLIALLNLNPKQIVKNCICIKNFSDYGTLHVLNNWKPEEGVKIDAFIDENFQAIFKNILSFNAVIPNFLEKFENTFGQPRVYASFNTYLASLHKLPSEQKETLLGLLTTYVETVLDSNDAFKRWRYSEDGDHLRTVFCIDPSLRESWTMNVETSLTDMIKVSNEDNSTLVFDFKNELLNAFQNNHISKQDYPELYSYLAAKIPKKVALTIPKEASKKEKQKMGFQIAAITLCEAKTPEEQQKMINKIDRIDWLPAVFSSQVKAWKNGLVASQIRIEDSYKEWTIKFTDDPFDLLLCGTEIEGSCQNVNLNVKTSKCLLAYVVDGKNKLVEVKGADGKIKARAVIRLLLDNENNPVLFLERIYPAMLSHKLTDAIMQMAKAQAKRMGLPLLSTGYDYGETYPYGVASFGSRAPFEYVDAIFGIQSDGIFTIDDVNLIQAS